MAKGHMTLAAFILEIRPIVIAYKFNIDVTTVYGWRDGKSCPRPKYISALVKLSKGRISHEEIVEGFVKARKSQRKNSK